MAPHTEPFLGILMLDTRFPRPPGDIGNALTFSRHGIPTRLHTVVGASPQRIVRDADPRFLKPFVDAAQSLVQQGAAMITTSCGFLAAYQAVLADAVGVPVITSSLLQCRDYVRPGIVTIDSAALKSDILAAVHVPVGTPVQGVMPDSEFHRRILQNDTTLDLDEACANVVQAAKALVDQHPEVAHIILECTNMPPYRAAVEQACGRPVHDIETLIVSRWQALSRSVGTRESNSN